MRVNHKNNCSNCSHRENNKFLLMDGQDKCELKKKLIDISKNLRCKEHLINNK
jgi:hypothetical protein